MKYSTYLLLIVICGFFPHFIQSLHAQEASLQEVLKCDEINDPAERLKCFDTVVDLLKSSPQKSVSANDKPPASDQADTSTAPPILPPPPPIAEELFGNPPPPKLVKGESPSDRPKKIKELVSGLKNYWINNDRDYVIVLDNGQIWQALDGSTLRFPSNPTEVRVRENFLGSYIMEIRNKKRGGRTGKVKRIR